MALRVDERPALTVIDGGRQDMTTPMPRYDATVRRRELQELIDSYDDGGLTVAAINAYADLLAARHPGTDAIDRGIAHAKLAAYMDGWLQGYDEGHNAGCIAELEFALHMLADATQLIPAYGHDRAVKAALDWLEARLRSELGEEGSER
jgi:hypothetical protein